MDGHINNKNNEVLWKLLAKPTSNGHLYASDLQDLVKAFPQSGLLHALLSHADSKQNISHAAAYVNPKTLYVLVNAPEILAEVSDKQITQQLSGGLEYATVEKAAPEHTEEELQSNHISDTVKEEKYHSYTETESAVNETAHEVITDTIDKESSAETIADVTDDEHNPVDSESIIEEKIEDDEHLAQVENEEVAEPTIDQRQTIEAIQEKRDEPEMSAENTTDEVIGETTTAEHQEHLVAENDELPANEDEITGSHQPEISVVSEPEPEIADQAIHDEPVKDISAEETIESPVAEQEIVETPAAEQEVTTDKIREDELLTETTTFALSEQPHSIDDEIYDEITGIENISFIQKAQPKEELIPSGETPAVEKQELPVAVTGESVIEPVAPKERALNMDDEAEKLIVGNIAATDYFVFDRAFTERKQAEPAEAEQVAAVLNEINDSQNTGIIPAEHQSDVSKYNDDTMPYTFMWWLNKTRKEHAGVYQPFKLDTTQAIRQQGADELQQQYYENIFHLSSVEELDRSTLLPSVEFDPKSKEDRIIKRFIIEEPHISTPSSDKLDTENKAKRSSEDQDEFVTETLAHIYVDQMLYHKAINTYKKLMLKFPEKSRYFADQIEQLERKTN